MFIALFLEVLGVLLSQKQMATVLLPFLHTADYQAPPVSLVLASHITIQSLTASERRGQRWCVTGT